MAQKTRIQLRRGVLADLPTLAEGEPGFTLDTRSLYIGDGTANHLINDPPPGNLLLNGGFHFFQRQTPLAWTSIFERVSGAYPSARKFAADRWAVQTNETSTDGIKVEARRYDDSLNYDDAGRPKVLALRRSATGKIAAYQVVEAANSVPLRGRKVLFQCRLRSAGNPQYVRLGIARWIGTPDTLPAKAIAAETTWPANPVLANYLNWVANSPTLNVPTDSWLDASLIADLSEYSDTTNLVAFVYNSAYTQDYNDILLIAEAALHDGIQPRPWLPRPIAAELALCQRYFWKNYNVDVAPASTAANVPAYTLVDASIAATAYYLTIPFGLNMRIPPALTAYSYNGLTGRSSNGSGTDYSANSAVFAAARESMCSVYNNSGAALAATANRIVYLGITADAEI